MPRWRSLVDVEFGQLGMDWSGAVIAEMGLCQGRAWVGNIGNDSMLKLTTRWYLAGEASVSHLKHVLISLPKYSNDTVHSYSCISHLHTAPRVLS